MSVCGPLDVTGKSTEFDREYETQLPEPPPLATPSPCYPLPLLDLEVYTAVLNLGRMCVQTL